LGAARERLEDRPLCAGEVLEPVREDRLAVPGVEVVPEPLRGAAALDVAVPELAELGAVRRVEAREVAADVLGLDECGLELAERAEQRVGEAAEAGGATEAVQARRRDRA